MSKARGLFIAVEGADFCGKTTFVKQLKELLWEADISSVIFRSPGGTDGGESIRCLVTNEVFSEEVRTLLFSANRVENTQNLIRPLITKGINVISTRWRWSSDVYQDNKEVADHIDKTLNVATPDIYILLECDEEVMIKHRNARNIEHPDYDEDAGNQLDNLDEEYTQNYSLVKERFENSFDAWEGKKFKFTYNTGAPKPPTNAELKELIKPFLEEIGFFDEPVKPSSDLVHDARFEYEGEAEEVDQSLLPQPRV